MQLIAWTKRLGMDARFQERYLNEGFSGGEKKRNEVLQMAMLEPVIAVLDETDSGLDIDALRAGRGRHRGGPQGPRPSSASCSSRTTSASSTTSRPDVVHVLIDGRIVATGDAELARDGRGRRASTRSAPARRSASMSPLDVADDQARLPAARARGQRQARHVPRLRVVVAEAARGARRDGRLLPALLRQHPPRRVHDRRGGDRRLRAGAAQGRRASSTRRRRRRSSSRATRPRRSTSSRTRGPAPTCRAGDAIVLSHMEHHANVVPWHMLAAERGVELRWIPMTDDFRLDLTEPRRAARRRPAARDHARCRTCSARSTTSARSPTPRTPHDALVLVDACQYVPHVATDVQAWDADFVAFSAHKMCGPSGIGALWARQELLEAMPPFLGGGEMIRDVRLDGFTTNDVPWKFEAGTHADRRGGRLRRRRRLPRQRSAWTRCATTRCGSRATRSTRSATASPTRSRSTARSTRRVRGGAVSFLFDGIHAHDISQVLDEDAVCVRAGHHCAKPLMRQLGVPATTRASFYVYNDEADVDVLVEALAKAQKFFTP